METLERKALAQGAVETPTGVGQASGLGRILVATNGASSAEPALRLANAMALEAGAAVELVTVFKPRVPIPASPAERSVPCERTDRGQVAELAKRVRRQRREIGSAPSRWPVRIGVGNPADVISRIARDEFDIVMLGIGRPDPAERLRGDETALRLALTASVPVLAVAPEMTGRPHRAVIAVDSMDDVDRRMIQTVVALLAMPAELHIALTRTWRFDAASGVRAARAAGVPESVAVFATPVPAESCAVIALAGQLGAELIAAPSHGRTPEERMVMQDLIVPILRSAHCSVLAVPPADDK